MCDLLTVMSLPAGAVHGPLADDCTHRSAGTRFQCCSAATMLQLYMNVLALRYVPADQAVILQWKRRQQQPHLQKWRGDVTLCEAEPGMARGGGSFGHAHF